MTKTLVQQAKVRTNTVKDSVCKIDVAAVKFSDLELAQNWEAAQVLKGKRLLNSFGLFRGVEVPESLLDEPLDSLPYWDRFYRFLGGEYRFTGESPKPAGVPPSGG